VTGLNILTENTSKAMTGDGVLETSTKLMKLKPFKITAYR
jgi:hypothetical protein